MIPGAILDTKGTKIIKRLFLKSRSPAFLYTDFTESSEKDGFLKVFSVHFSVLRGCRVLKSL